MTKKEHYDTILKALLERITTWDQFYTFLGDRMGAVREGMHPVIIIDTMFTMYAFFVAMRDNPEESDITVLVTKMVDTLVYHSQEKMGVDLDVVFSQTVVDLSVAESEVAAAGGTRILH